MKKKIVVISFILITTLCGCSSPQVNKTDDITETKTYLYSYDYETETNGEVSTAYHEEKPSVDLNESHREVEPIVNFRSKAGLTFIKMNETYTSGTIECTVLKAYSTVSKQFAADTFGEEYSQLLLDKINKFQGYYDENGNLYNEGHRFFLIKMHMKYLGKTTSKIQFDSPIICKYPDGTYYSLGGIDYIDKALLENESHHITLNPGDEFDSWFLYEAYRYSHDKTYYLRGSFQNYIDDDSYSGYLALFLGLRPLAGARLLTDLLGIPFGRIGVLIIGHMIGSFLYFFRRAHPDKIRRSHLRHRIAHTGNK